MDDTPRRDGRHKSVVVGGVLTGLGGCLWLVSRLLAPGSSQNAAGNIGVLLVVLGFCLLVVAFSKKKSP